MNLRKLLIISLIVFWSLFLGFNNGILFAEDSDDENKNEEQALNEEDIEELEDKIEEYEKKIGELGGKAKTLANDIESINSQIKLTELRIQNSISKIYKTSQKIVDLAGDIENLKLRIGKLEESIAFQQGVLNSRLRERYKSRETSPVVILFGSSTMNRLIQKTEYLKVMELQDNRLLEEMSRTKDAFSKQKDLFIEKKEEEEQLKRELEIEKVNLDSYKATIEDQKSEKDRLLNATQNDEAKYQELLAEAKAELESYSAFVASSGLGIIGPNGLGGGKGGWYYSQRDSQWANDSIGGSSYSVYQSGCLVSSVAMLHKYYGHNMDPGDLADHDEYYFWGNMLIPWPAPSGLDYKLLGWGYSKSSIDKELDKDNPVIVGITANNAAGTHFVVLLGGEDGDYKMHDPIYGPDLDFDDYYSTDQIFEMVAFK